MIRTKIYTPIRNLNKDNFHTIWKLLADPIFDAKKFDISEPLQGSYDLSASVDAYQLVENGLIVKGHEQSFLSTRHKPTGLTHWIFDIDTSNNEIQLIELLKKFNTILPIVYGMLCSVSEYDTKHKVTRESSVGWRGTSMWDFQKFLPGVYWLNIFGEKLADAIGREKILHLADISVMNWDHETIAFHLNSQITPANMDIRIEQERTLRKALGEDYFFDIAFRNEIEFSHPKEFKNYLNKLEKDY